MIEESEDGCSARTVRQEMRGKDPSRARRGKVVHLRDEPLHSDRTLCGVNADSARTRTVRSGVWLGLGELQCRNCSRALLQQAQRTQRKLECWDADSGESPVTAEEISGMLIAAAEVT